MMPTLGGFATVRDNNFNLLRCLAALMVIYAHSWGLSALGEEHDPLSHFLGYSTGALAVNAFFIISGYLVTQSWGRQRSLLSFCRARVLRVLPGLFGVLVFTLLSAGFCWSSLAPGEFFSDSQTWKYFYKNLLMIRAEYDLPGVFAFNHYPEAVNGSLWTLKYEMKMYLTLAVLGLLGYLSGLRLRVFVGLFVLWYAGFTLSHIWIAEPPVDAVMLKLSLCFFLGGAAALFGQRLPLNAWVLLPLAALMLLTRGTFLYDLCSALFLAYALFWIAYVPRGAILGYNRLGDYSYGLYLYAFPIQQALVMYWPEMTPMVIFALASLLTLVCAIGSWYLIEKPALDWCKRLNAVSDRQLAAAVA